LESRKQDNVPDTRDDGAAEGYVIEKGDIIEIMRIGLTSADIHITEML
jgi:hypothetical protein